MGEMAKVTFKSANTFSDVRVIFRCVRECLGVDSVAIVTPAEEFNISLVALQVQLNSTICLLHMIVPFGV